MYIRFVSARRDTCARAETGLFGAAYHCLRAPCPGPDLLWQIDELACVVRWFEAELRVPRRLQLRPGRKGNRNGICWFRPTARAHIAQAHYLAWLLSDLGEPIRRITSPAPGTILWQDDHQIVALATGQVPRAFH